MSNIIDKIQLSGVTYDIGGSGGITSGEVQTMIDSSISGKVDTSIYTAYTASTDTALSGKQETLVSGTNIKTINHQSLLGSGNIDIQGGGGSGGTAVEEMTQAEYDDAASAGTLDAETLYIITDAPEINANEYVSKAENTVSATAIFVNYQDNFSNQDYGANIVKSVTFDYRGDKSSTTSQQASFSIVDLNTWSWYDAYAYFDYTNGTYTKDDSNNILDVVYDSSIEDFKVTMSTNYPNCNISNVQFYGGYIRVPSSTITSGQSANVIQTSIANTFSDIYTKNLNNVRNCYFNVYNNDKNKIILAYDTGRFSSVNGGQLQLEDLKAENRNGYNYLSSDINIPLGTSDWTEVTNLSQDSCNVNYLGDIKPFTVFRISGDTSDLSYWGLQIAVGNAWSYSWDNILWDTNENTFVRQAGWSPDVFSATTVNWDSNTGYLTISYPDTFILDEQERQTEIYYLNSNNCVFGSYITKFEYYTEITQPLKPYVQQLRSDVNTLSGQVATKQTTLTAGTGISIVDNVISATGGGGGGKAVVGGRGITVTTGATADTVSLNLAISAGTGSDSIIGGYFGNKSLAQYGFAFGDNAKCMNSGSACMAFGRNVTSNATAAFVTGCDNEGTNIAQAVFGQYSVNNKANSNFGDSGNTLFSIGNGTSTSARHNAFEVRQNGDIYITSGGTDIKLQDHLGGGGSSINVVQTTGSSTTDVMSQAAVTSAIPTVTNTITSGSTDVITSGAVYDALGDIETLLSQI